METVQELFCPVSLWIIKELFRSVLFYNVSLIHKDHSVCYGTGKFHLMSDDQHGHSCLCKFQYYLKYFSYHLRIKCCCNLIQKHDLRMHQHGTYNGNSLFLTTGKLPWIIIFLIQKTNSVKKLLRFLFHFFFISFLYFHWCQKKII